MALTYAQAEMARRDVLAAFNIYLPTGLADKVRARNIQDIVKILPQAQYKIHFSDVFYRFFANANVVAFGRSVDDPDKPGTGASEGGTVRLIRSRAGATVQDKISAFLVRRDDALGLCNCPAFTSPAINVLARNVYVNADMAQTSIGTLYHEFIHYLQHGNLYPEFYALGGKNIGVLEGITEFFTRRIDPAITIDRANGAKYQVYFDDISRRIGTSMPRRNALIRYCFQGEPYVDLGGMQPRL